MHNVNFSVSSSEIVMLYYIIALSGTEMPAFDDAQDLGPAPYLSTESRYKKMRIDTPGVIEYIEIDELVAETSYIIFIYAIDQGKHVVQPKNLTFTTASTIHFSSCINLTPLRSIQCRQLCNEIQAGCSQSGRDPSRHQCCCLRSESVPRTVLFPFFPSTKPSIRIQQQKYFSNSRLLPQVIEEPKRRAPDGGSENRYLEAFFEPIDAENRILQSPGLTTIPLQIMPWPEKSYYPSPIELANRLNNKTALLNAKLQRFDTTYNISATSASRYTSTYANQPVWSQSGYTWSSFTGSLSTFGYLFVTVVKASEDTGVPTPYQIWEGFTNKNIPTDSGYVEVSKPSTLFTVNVTDLDDNTAYKAYIIGGSAHPGFPDLMPQLSVVSVAFQTKQIPIGIFYMLHLLIVYSGY